MAADPATALVAPRMVGGCNIGIHDVAVAVSAHVRAAVGARDETSEVVDYSCARARSRKRSSHEAQACTTHPGTLGRRMGQHRRSLQGIRWPGVENQAHH